MTSRWLLLLLRRLLPKGDAEVILGDLAEEYAIRNDTRWLIRQCLRSLLALWLPALGFTLLAALIWFGSQFVLLMAIAAICGLVSVRGNDLRTIHLVVWLGQAIVSFAAGLIFAGNGHAPRQYSPRSSSCTRRFSRYAAGKLC